MCLQFQPVREAAAAVNATKVCGGTTATVVVNVNDSVTCILRVTGSTTGGVPDMPDGTIISIVRTTDNYALTLSIIAECTVNIGTCTATAISNSVVQLRCLSAGCFFTEVRITESVTIVESTPSNISQEITVVPPPPDLPFTPLRIQGNLSIVVSGAVTDYFVATDGDDNNRCRSEDPCKTIHRALEVARDGDRITVRAGEYEIDRVIRVLRLVTIQAEGKVVLRARPGIIIFEVTAQGGPNFNRHVTIQGFTMGGNYQKGSSAPAILLNNDSYTEILNNIIGALDLVPPTPAPGSSVTRTATPTRPINESLAINNGIVLSNSDHPLIRDNTIQGSTRFAFTPVLTPGKNVTGFGVVTFECLGGVPSGVSDNVRIENNLFTNVWLAGIWLCSDGAGKHEIRNNVFRNNWRGIALKDVTNSLIIDNSLIDGQSDGMIIYGASLHNRIENNQIESHIAPSAAAIRIGWLADPIVPLFNTITRNRIVRVTIGIHVFGARTTVITGNEIKVTGVRTGILITPSTFPLDPSTQPRDTEITAGNILVFNGPCGPVLGCAIRLLGTTVDVKADGNDYGLRRSTDVEGFIWHRPDDRSLGLVRFTPFTNQMDPSPTPTPTPIMPGNGSLPPLFPPATMPPSNGMNGGAGTLPVALNAGCNNVQWAGPNDLFVTDALMGIMPVSLQRTATIWRRTNGDWEGWGIGRGAPADVFTLRRGEPLLVCVDAPGTFQVPISIGGP